MFFEVVEAHFDSSSDLRQGFFFLVEAQRIVVIAFCLAFHNVKRYMIN
jgi:hypothetical protein